MVMVPSSFGFVTSPITVIESPSDSFEAISCPLNSSEESIVARRNDNSAKRGGEIPPSPKVLHNAKVAKDAGGFADCFKRNPLEANHGASHKGPFLPKYAAGNRTTIPSSFVPSSLQSAKSRIGLFNSSS
jgi:hypothetical protein